MSYSKAIEVLEKCIREKIPEKEGLAILVAIQKTVEKDPTVCIDLESTIRGNTGECYYSESQTVLLCDGSHVHYIPARNMLVSE